ncbi:MAG TPA: hypothetical protein VM388_05965 [Acidimicrobiales bacterium]|nr:hypothetical protein [Acidimicrobiales bacterium]HWI03489.1 hypothetical protein [Acidimicrobiales bacterium]
MSNDDFSLEELEAQHTAELPSRQLMTGLALGLPYLGVGGVGLYVEVGPVELFAGVYV